MAFFELFTAKLCGNQADSKHRTTLQLLPQGEFEAYDSLISGCTSIVLNPLERTKVSAVAYLSAFFVKAYLYQRQKENDNKQQK